MTSEMWQFAAFLGVAFAAFVLWLNIIYLPGRTLEQRYDGVKAHRKPSEGDSLTPDDREVSRTSSDPTR